MPAALLLLALFAQDPDLTDLDREVLKHLSTVRESGAFVLHHNADDVSAAQVDQAAAACTRAFAELEKLLDMKFAGKIHVFLYRDPADMAARTRNTQAAAFSTGTRSIHSPHEVMSQPAAPHEMTHIFAVQFPRPALAVDPDWFLIEGLATWAQKIDRAPIDAWAAAYDRRGALPSLVALRRQWPGGVRTGVHPYHVAGSFVGWLARTYGVDKVKRFYVNSLEAHLVFGRTFVELERDWRAFLFKYDMLAENEKVVGRLPREWREAKGKPLDGWSASAAWKREGAMLVGKHDDAWALSETKERWKGSLAVKARVRLTEGHAFQVRLNGKNEAVLTTWGAFLMNGAAGAEDRALKLEAGRWVELALVNEAGTLRLYLDGWLALELGNAPLDEAPVSIGIERGRVEVDGLSLFVP